jgi:hypothetical protein
MWLLTLVFACGISCGGNPDHVDLGTYASYQACSTSGLQWIKREANPQRAVKTYTCHVVKK